MFAGQTYSPLSMFWERITISAGMPTEVGEVALSNVGNQVVRFIKEVDITGNTVLLQLLHLDLLSQITARWTQLTKILASRADINAAVFILGRDLGRNRLPRRMILANEAE